MLTNPWVCFFSEGSEAPQEAATQPQRAWGDLKSLKNNKIHKIHAPTFWGRVFSEVAEVPQAAATQTHRAGDPETDKQHQFQIHMNFIYLLHLREYMSRHPKYIF